MNKFIMAILCPIGFLTMAATQKSKAGSAESPVGGDKDAELGARAFETGMEELTGAISPEEAAKEFAELNQEARAAGLPECDPQQMAASFDPNALDDDDDGDSDGDDGLGD